MTDDWQVPTGHGGYGQGQPHQWGMAPPGYEAVYLVQRPPRPGVVNIAVVLTYVGLVLAALSIVIGAVISWQLQRAISGLSASSTISGSMIGNNLAIGIMINVVLLWLLPGAGAVVTAVLSARGANPARIVLASLMALFALVNLCQAAGAGLGTSALSSLTRTSGLSLVGAGWFWADVVLHVIQFGLAVTIGILLIVPAANRYYSAGPGRRFAVGAAPVPSTDDRA
jgi:hypothetical protein